MKEHVYKTLYGHQLLKIEQKHVMIDHVELVVSHVMENEQMIRKQQ